MKTKPFDKKLVLNKKTVAHLNNSEMKAVEGGDMPLCVTIGADTCISYEGWTCGTCIFCPSYKSDCTC